MTCKLCYANNNNAIKKKDYIGNKAHPATRRKAINGKDCFLIAHLIIYCAVAYSLLTFL